MKQIETVPVKAAHPEEGEIRDMTVYDFWRELGLRFSGSKEKAEELVNMMKSANETKPKS